jgi:hypothetical protein
MDASGASDQHNDAMGSWPDVSLDLIIMRWRLASPRLVLCSFLGAENMQWNSYFV